MDPGFVVRGGVSRRGVWGFNEFLISLIGLYFRCLSFLVVLVNNARPGGAFLFIV